MCNGDERAVAFTSREPVGPPRSREELLEQRFERLARAAALEMERQLRIELGRVEPYRAIFLPETGRFRFEFEDETGQRAVELLVVQG